VRENLRLGLIAGRERHSERERIAVLARAAPASSTRAAS
jgi:hypothetical protein